MFSLIPSNCVLNDLCAIDRDCLCPVLFAFVCIFIDVWMMK